MNTARVLHLAGIRLLAAAPVPLSLLQVRADDVDVEPARQSPLPETAAALQESSP
ncbi:hypothetical protein [Streptomyces sp. NPDC046862]|uniref:hypothetical protein n=1 Tax=Streptomyces sp. NPDC046862 TaxID=3154603 RepID=UPI003453E765